MNINSLSIYSYEFDKIYVGFSGGADSTALLLLLQAVATTSSQHTFKLEAVHFEHGLRGEESLCDAEWCRIFCETRKIPLKVVSLNMNPDQKNMEAEARRRRLEYWIENVNSLNEAVALGHHADDKIENLILRLIRGSNSSGLTSLRTLREFKGVTILRPLLQFRRAEIEEFLRGEGIFNWCEDSTNKELKYRRSIIRNVFLPELKKAFPDCDKALLKSLNALEIDADFLEQQADKSFAEIKNLKNIKIAKFAELHPALRVRLIRLWLSHKIEKDYIPSADFMERFNHALAKFTHSVTAHGERKSIPVINNCALVFEKGMIRFERGVDTVIMPFKRVWNWQKKAKLKYGDYEFSIIQTDSLDRSFFSERSHKIVCFNADLFPKTLIIRPREPGDKIVPFGKDNPVTVKKLLEDTTLLTNEKRDIPIVTNTEGKVIWIPGVRRSNFANIKVDENRHVQFGNFIILKSAIVNHFDD